MSSRFFGLRGLRRGNSGFIVEEKVLFWEGTWWCIFFAWGGSTVFWGKSGCIGLDHI